MHRLQIGRAADLLAGMVSRFFKENLKASTEAAAIEDHLLPIDFGLQPLQPFRFDRFADLIVHLCARGAAPCRVFERERAREPNLADEFKSSGKVLFGFAREADDEIGGQRQIGPCCASLPTTSK